MKTQELRAGRTYTGKDGDTFTIERLGREFVVWLTSAGKVGGVCSPRAFASYMICETEPV
jgi:hypothetical protein